MANAERYGKHLPYARRSAYSVCIVHELNI